MSFAVRVQSSGSRKIETIKLVRELLGCGLREAKDRVEAAPFTVPVGGDRSIVDAIVARFRALGLSVDLVENEQVVDAAAVPTGDGPFRVIVDNVGSRKIMVIKLVREITQLDLLGAKNLVDQGAFQIERDLDGHAATSAAERLAEAGATARVTPAPQSRASATPQKPTPPPPKMGPMPY